MSLNVTFRVCGLVTLRNVHELGAPDCTCPSTTTRWTVLPVAGVKVNVMEEPPETA
jgi:hypothetical protein